MHNSAGWLGLSCSLLPAAHAVSLSPSVVAFLDLSGQEAKYRNPEGMLPCRRILGHVSVSEFRDRGDRRATAEPELSDSLTKESLCLAMLPRFPHLFEHSVTMGAKNRHRVSACVLENIALFRYR